MRALEIMGSLHRGGAETMVMNYYRAFDKSVCQMDFIVHALFNDDYREEAQSMGARIILLERPGEVGAIRYIKDLTKAIQENGPYDVIHIHTNYQAFLGVLAGRLAGVKNIVVHSHNTSFPKKYLLINRCVMSLFRVKRVACGEAAGKAFFGKHRYVFVPNAIDMKKFRTFDPNECKKLKQDTFGNKYVVGHLGRFSKQKNHEFILDLAQKMEERRTDIIFVCYGEGEEEKRITQLIKERNIKNIRLMGVTKDVVATYHMFDVFILPSLWEGFPVTLVESQLTGVPSLTSDNVSQECDLKLGLLEYLPLDVNIWMHRIISEIGCNRTSEKNTDVLDLYDVNVQWKNLYEVYCS